MNQKELQAVRNMQAHAATMAAHMQRLGRAARDAHFEFAVGYPWLRGPKGIREHLRYADAWLAYRLVNLARRAGLRI